MAFKKRNNGIHNFQWNKGSICKLSFQEYVISYRRSNVLSRPSVLDRAGVRLSETEWCLRSSSSSCEWESTDLCVRVCSWDMERHRGRTE